MNASLYTTAEEAADDKLTDGLSDLTEMSEASALIDSTIKLAKKLMVEPSATLGLSLHSSTRTI